MRFSCYRPLLREYLRLLHPMTMGTATEVLDQLLYAVAVVIRIFAPCFGERGSAPADGRVYFHAMSAYARRFGRFRYLRSSAQWRQLLPSPSLARH